MDAELKKFEEELERLCPVAMPDGMIARMEAAMDGWQEEPTDENVVRFPSMEAGKAGGSRNGFWAAAAAVALLGALAAFLVPTNPRNNRVVNNAGSGASYTPASFSPVGASSNIVAASDEGFVVTEDAIPHRAVRVEYMNQIDFTNKRGERLQVEVPRVRIVLIPVRVD
jgi:hypothetical protein